MCAEQIPLAAVTCEYCGAQFEVTSTGYCQNCHEVREADGNGQCKVCGNAVMDLRVESKFIEEQFRNRFPCLNPLLKLKYQKPKKPPANRYSRRSSDLCCYWRFPVVWAQQHICCLKFS